MPKLPPSRLRSVFCTWLSACSLGLLLSTAAHAKLEINQASEAQLDSLLHVGPALSQKMLSQRQQSPFADWSDLIRRVPGIGPRRAQQLSEQGLTVGGQPYPAKPEPGAQKP